jgi:phosphatidylglycerophosphate synthase
LNPEISKAPPGKVAEHIGKRIKTTATYHAWITLSATLIFLFLRSTEVFISAVAASFFLFYVVNRPGWKALGRVGGYANAFTLLRLLVLLALCAFHSYVHNYLITGIALLIIIGDGIDGYLARNFNAASTFGEYFDAETDAFFVLALGVVLLDRHMVGTWILLPGLLRYGYMVILSFMKVRHHVTGSSFMRQLVGVWLMSVLMVSFITKPEVYVPNLIIATGMVSVSFMVDFWLLLRSR